MSVFFSRSTTPPSRRHRAVPALCAAAWLGLSVAGGSCGSDPQGTTPCETVYLGKCGAPCINDLGCLAGQYCGPAGTCTADCAPNSMACAAGQVCTPEGRCQPAGSSGPTSSAATGGTGGGSIDGGSPTGAGGLMDGCADITVTFDKLIPTVMLLIDQSGSMSDPFGAGSRWSVLYDTLMNPVTGAVKPLENDVRFGLALYTSNNGSSGGVCPLLTEVSILLGNHAAIDTVFGAAQPVNEGDTPTGDSIDAVAAKLVPFAEPGPKVIVLATDGEPDTCAVPDPQTGQPQSVAAAQAAFAKGIQTFIISVGPDVTKAHLQDVANAGAGLPVGGPMNAPYYQALDQQALIQAFKDIINGVRSCVLTLNGVVDVTAADQGKVTIDGQSIPYNDPNGWKLNSPTELELVGAACDLIQTGQHTVTVVFPCGTVEIPH